ncbi:unnamed protein product [Psylliodes chrysocephalus]|uniref:Uncharacterized protein n=1 Tax=Psylliodes chrysocephalus TaxID=3402493 RepID=A0A9P0CLI7_9CUCU|nr:unnamed protein product [Psylliodes chrysocephala]
MALVAQFVVLPFMEIDIQQFATCVMQNFGKHIAATEMEVYKKIEEVYEHIDKKILPKEYGGEVPLKEMLDKFKIFLKEKRESVLALDDMYIEIDEKTCSLVSEMNEELGSGVEGSFKKLTVD